MPGAAGNGWRYPKVKLPAFASEPLSQNPHATENQLTFREPSVP
jgi:hypothetical protein